MGWVVGIREVRFVEVRVSDSREHGPRLLAPKREVVNLPHEAWGRLMHFRVALPVYQRAERRCEGAGVLAWSMKHLLDPLAAYYATYEPPMRWGNASAPRGGR